jgi:hypothetical protein
MSRIAAVDPASADPRSKPLLDAALEGLLGPRGAVGNGSFNGKTREASLLGKGRPVAPHRPSSDIAFGDAAVKPGR